MGSERLTRKAFVRGYAERSGIDAKYASLGYLDVAGHVLVALPCACGEDECEGWAMVAPSSVNSHLELYAPEPIASAIYDLAEGRPSGEKQ